MDYLRYLRVDSKTHTTWLKYYYESDYMHGSNLDPFNLQSLSNSLIVSQIMSNEIFVSSIKVMNQNLVILDHFDGTNFTH